LFGRSKDLRVANLLLQSNVALDGLDGLADGLLLVRELLGQYWDGVYPLLDADDDNDPTFRINALTGLVAEAATDEQGGAAPVAAVAAPAPRASGEIANREDVLRQLDRLLEYYVRHEPSSPVPVLLKRAKTLVTADFAEIVRNLIPDGISQFETLRGPESE
ncbi:type VI secretion system ImpA family N-terminal domain-containing protein, partial [Pseudomonas aeruginosa]